jgi:putative phosphoribosyl transferase
MTRSDFVPGDRMPQKPSGLDLQYDVTMPVQLDLPDVILSGDLHIPQEPQGIVVFAHGSGSSRLSPRNRYVAGMLQENALGTLLIDLLDPEEERIDEFTREHRFNIPLLAGRLVRIIGWLEEQPGLKDLPVGLFGASTGAGAALMAAGQMPEFVRAVVSRGGRPDLAAEHLGRVEAPTLLIVGERDTPVIALNRQAQAKMTVRCEIAIVPGATHLFEEPGTLENAARLATGWFQKYLTE